DIRRNAKALEEIIRDEAVDIVHARSRAPAWAGERAARATKTPFVTTYHGTYSENSSLKKRYNAVMAKGQPTIAISEFIAELVQNRYKKPASEIVVIPRGADINIFAEELVSTPRTIALAERWGVADDPRPIVLLPARLSPWKGHNTLIAAAKGLKERAAAAGTTPDLNIVFSGGGSSAAADKLLKAIDDAGVNDLVRWVDHTADMEAAYKLSAVVVSASTEPEAFGRVAVEAQAMGRPVIATAHGGSLETIDAGQTGWLYPPGDATALADAIEEALALDSSGRAHMGMAGRARIRSRFTIDAMKRATLQVYEDAAIPR
ncbi:MAG: glycosyltransferase family 4 protein, partial [Pseudomonadota bacterium]